MIKSIQQLIDMKTEIEEKRNKEYILHLDDLDTDVKYKLAKRTEILNIQEMDKTEIDPYLIYSHVTEPNLADASLQAAYEMDGLQPFQIVDKLFSMEEVGKLSMAIIGQCDKKDMVKEIKNL